MELQRDIYDDLLKWKNHDSSHVLELRGARQVGKTYILDKFARENYNTYIYINMVETSGREYLECLEQATGWEPGILRKEKPLHEAFSLLDSRFQDTKDTIIVIDEIQESAKVYSLVRQFAREFACHFVVARSYLGKTYSKEDSQPVGDLDILDLYTLSFEEFLGACGKRQYCPDVDLYGESPEEDHDELERCFDIYCRIGGYPSVVKRYLENGQEEAGLLELNRVVRGFVEESQHNIEKLYECDQFDMFEQILPAITRAMIKGNGVRDLVTELSEKACMEEKRIHQALAWLYHSRFMDFCGKAGARDPVSVSMRCRFYFMDVGVCRYFLDISGADRAVIRGIVNENFVYIKSLKRTGQLGG